LQLENGQHNLPVGREKLGPEFNSLERKLFELLPESDFTPEIREQLKTFYREGTTFRDAFARWFLHIFSGQGVVLAGSDDSGIKSLIAEPMIAAAEHHESFTKHLDEQSARLEENGFHRQALVQNSNIFYLDPEHGRQKLDMKGGQWKTRNGVAWSSSELVREIRNRPGFFSPNVFLRPLMQDLLIPTLAYVSGPGELSYYAQMKRAYEWMGQDMPMLLPRFSMTLKEPAIERIGKKLPFDFHEYARRIEDLETLYLERTGASDIENLFSSWTAGIEKVTAENMKWIEEIDPTLKASADKAGVLAQKEVSKVKAKTYRAIKKQEKIQLNRIHRIRENLFPGGELQERQVAFIYYLNKYGPDIWDRLGETLKDEIPDSHKIVYL
ncbi:MAG: bacillithiol biosynthesis cysteine-adding enzyme BshC, partial [Balneolaceae bacterium]